MRLRSAPKAGGDRPRTIPPAETIRRVRRLAEEAGVTRLADITGLDRVGLPVYSAIVPKSRDMISVYNGKGLGAVDARAGALMEALERQTVLNARLPVREGSFRELSRHNVALDPRTISLRLRPDYSQERAYSWVEGHDLIAGETVLVPAKLAGYFWDDVPHPSCFDLVSTHGMASGNCLEEAVAHALCELIERDALTLAALGSHWIPLAQREHELGVEAGACGWDDLELYPSIDFDGAGQPLEELIEQFRRAGLRPVVRDITSDLGIPSVLACAAEDLVPGFPQAHLGLGTHPDARLAVTRALTELAQSRAVDIQGVREDIAPPDARTRVCNHARRLSKIERRSWYYAGSQSCRPLRDLPSYSNQDILDDIRLMLRRLVAQGIERAIVVDFSPAHACFSVIRLIVPGLESWAIDRSRPGRRALDYWRQRVAALMQ